jgi:CubicO group peptidase (beta-lactamase class C family)
MPYARIVGEYLWTPLGAESDAYITLDLQGTARTAGDICATLRDLAHFGEMMRNDGVSNSKQVVPSWWIHDSRSRSLVARRARRGLSRASRFSPTDRFRSRWLRGNRNQRYRRSLIVAV